MTRATADTESHGADTDTTRKRQEHGGADNETAVITGVTGRHSHLHGNPQIVRVEGLTPVESSLDSQGQNVRPVMRQKSSAQTPSSIDPDERMPLKPDEKVVAPMAEAEDAEVPEMVEIDLGDGGGGDTGASKKRRDAPSNRTPVKNGSHPHKDDPKNTKSQTNRPNSQNVEADKQDSNKPTEDGITPLPETGNLRPGKDEPDAASVYSLYMETDFRYYFQHPYFRLFVAYFVTLCNFLIYAEDPVAHSRKESNIPVIGNCFAFVGTKYPPNAWSLLKVILWLAGTIVGMIIGKIFFHTFLFNKIFRLKMFNDDKGSWMTMFMTTILSVFIFSYIYNLFLLIGGDATDRWHISPYMSISNSIFMKAAATGTWCGDFFTAWMVTDMMLQEKLYPLWAKKPRKWWNTGIRRIILFWIIVSVSSFIVIFVIATDYIQWDKLNHDFLHSNELSRAFLASFILVCDIIIVMQDWDFPHFVSAIDIKLPGVNTAHIRFKIPRLLRRLEYWHVHISGKWFNYGILFIVILLDLNMWKNQIFYSPFEYGQYVDSEGRIHSVEDEYSLVNFNETLLSFAYRNITKDPITGKRYIELDNVMNARYNGYSIALKALAFVPSIAVFITFGVLIWQFGRSPKPTKEDPYGGRLKKRRRRFSARRTWRSFRKHSAAVLTAFRWRRDARNRAAARQAENAEGVDGTRGNAEEGTVEMTLQPERQAAENSGDGGARESTSPPLRTIMV